MADIYNKAPLNVGKPFTADNCDVMIDGNPAYAVNVQVNYQQPVTRKRSIGKTPTSVIYTGMPVGQVSIQQLGLVEGMKILSGNTFKQCGNGEVTFTLSASCEGGSQTFRAIGAIASMYGIQLESDGSTVLTNVVIDFLQFVEG